MTCDTGAHGSPEPGNYIAGLMLDVDAEWNTATERIARRHQLAWDNPMELALFGLARQREFPGWVCVDMDKPLLDLGPGNKIIHGAIRCEYPEYNFEAPFNNPEAYESSFTTINPSQSEIWGWQDNESTYRATLPFSDGSVGGIYAVNILEHLWDPRPIMEECARVLAPGAPLNIVVPHGSHGIYLQDLDHKKPFILDSWKNWLSNGYWGPDRSHLKLRVGANFKFGIKEENVNIMTQLVKVA